VKDRESVLYKLIRMLCYEDHYAWIFILYILYIQIILNDPLQVLGYQMTYDIKYKCGTHPQYVL
jgi:hypothetical protein